MPRPDLLDNLAADTTHRAALAWLVGDLGPEHPLAVATGYVNLGGLHHLAAIAADGRAVRLLLGALPEPGLGAELPLQSFELQLAMLQGERDFSRFPPSRAAERLAAVERWLVGGRVEVRRYVTRFLHGKAYLLGSADDPRATLVSSANLTAAGLEHNLELGIVDHNPGPGARAQTWFDRLWGEAAPFTEELRALLFPAVTLVDPETVWLRALLELYGAELEGPRPREVSAVALAPFQRDGYERARAILARHRGVLYADGVGTGKTEIGLAFIDEYVLRRGQMALVVCPAQLKPNWQRRIDQARLSAQVVSFTELATDEQLVPEAAAARLHLHADKEAYRLVVVDEAHALRTEGTTWYRAMERLLGGEPKDAVLLTATPVNNGLWDLYNLVMLFARHDRAFAADGIPSIRELFVAAGANERDPENLEPDVLFPLADAVSVRRDRRFIAERYPGETFADGTPVRFPTPRLTTERYDLDAAHPDLVADIVAGIERLEMARYRPGAFLREPDETAAEAQLGGLLQSALLKRFESCWAACLATVTRMIAAHDAFLAAWEAGRVPSREALLEAATADAGDAGLASWVAERLAGDPETRPAAAFRDEYGAAVAADRAILAAIAERLGALGPEDDPKLALLRDLLDSSPAQKVAVFATYGETVRYLDEQLAGAPGGRERVVVVGAETDPDSRMGMLARFAPRTVVREDYEPPEGEVDLLLATDVLSEGQNLQQAQAVVSYDMPWNPQRVVQRNGRVIRLRSPHEEVFLTTLLPAAGQLDEMLRLEATIRRKIRAAGVFGMESEVIDDVVEEELRSYAGRLAAGADDLLEGGEEGEAAAAFLGESLRAALLRAAEEGEVQRLLALPWGIGAGFRAPGRVPGVFFATRTRPMATAEDGYRYWRFVPLDPDAPVVASDAEMVRLIDPGARAGADLPADLDMEGLWRRACSDIVATHNRRTDPRRVREAIGPAQRFALEVLRDPTVILPEGAEAAADALAVERSLAVRRALNEVRTDTAAGAISANEAAERIVRIVNQAGLRPVALDELPEEIEAGDLGVVCWMLVLG